MITQRNLMTMGWPASPTSTSAAREDAIVYAAPMSHGVGCTRFRT